MTEQIPPPEKKREKGDEINASPTAIKLAFEKREQKRIEEMQRLLFKNGVTGNGSAPQEATPEVSPEVKEHEAEEQKEIDARIKASRAEGKEDEVIDYDIPDKKARKAAVAPTVETTGESKEIPPELVKIYGDKDKVPPEKLKVLEMLKSKEKRKDFLAKTAAEEAERKKKEEQRERKKQKATAPKVEPPPEDDALLDLFKEKKESLPQGMHRRKRGSESEPHKEREYHDSGYINSGEISSKFEGTPKELHKRLSDLIVNAKGKLYEAGKRAKEKITSGERSESLKKYLIERSKELSEKAKEYKGNPEKLIRDIGENYNKLNWKTKLALTGGLIAGISLTSTIAPILSGILGTALYGQRVLGGIGFAVGRRKVLDAKIAANPNHWLAKKSERVKNAYAIALAGAYMGTTSFAVYEGVQALNELGVNGWLGNMLGHQASVPTHAPETAPEVASSTASGIIHQPAATATANEVAPDTVPDFKLDHPLQAPATPEIPDISVGATKGHGYEYMMKKVWEGLQDLKSQGLDPTKYAEGSDMRRLLEADANSIDKVVHQIASDPGHHFYNADGTSVHIDLGSQMTINAEGDIQLGDAVKAPEGAPVTAPFHPEAPAATPEDVQAPTPAAQPPKSDLFHGTPPEDAAHPPTPNEPPPPSLTPAVEPTPTPPFENVTIETQEPMQPIVAPEYQNTTTALDHDTTPPVPAEAAVPSSVVEGPNAYVNSLGTPINPDVTHAYACPNGVCFFGGKISDLEAQDYAIKNNVSVLVDKSEKSFWGFSISRAVEFVPAKDGSVTMVVLNGPKFVPDPTTFTKRLP